MCVMKWVWVLLFATNCECFVNLICEQGLTATATMSNNPYGSFGPSNAIDGDTGAHNPCTAMDVHDGYTSVWWKVWLEKTFNVAEIEIYFQTGTIYRSTGFSIYVYDTESYIPPSDETLVYQHDPTTGCPPQSMTIPVNRVTQGIAFYNTEERALNSTCKDKSPGKKVVEICEVNILGCDDIRYGENCAQICDRNCLNQHCDVSNGECIYGCREQNHAGPHCTECDNTHYLSDCGGVCGHCKNGSQCHNITGNCIHGCQPNWQPPSCQECDDKHYWSDCSGLCGHCKNGERCHNITGHCRDGCQPNWQGSLCLECDNNHYSSDCSGVCGHCKNGEQCHNITGHCANGCQPNWQEPFCKVCKYGFYGLNCSIPCGYCQTRTFCDKVTGVCPYGCQNHWSGSQCRHCKDGFYGWNCSIPCGHCRTGMFCNNVTGVCPKGCQEHWRGPKCDECADGFYGLNCSESCGHCKTGVFCDKVTGVCPSGCQDHWRGSKCNVCNPYKYGPNCAFDCGHCKDGRPCSTGNGSCLNGCEDGWKEPSCLTAWAKLERLRDTKTDRSPAIGLYVTIGVITTLFVISVLMNAILIHKVRKHVKQPSTPYHESQPQDFVNHIEMEETHEYDKLGVMNTDDYQELPPVVSEQPPQERNVLDSSYINSTLH